MRAVADTNVLISAFLFGGVPRAFLDLGVAKAFTLMTSDVLLIELAEKLRGKFQLPSDQAQAFLSRLIESAVVVRRALNCKQFQRMKTTTAFLNALSQAKPTSLSAETSTCCGSVRTNPSPSSTSGSFLQLPDCGRIDSLRACATRSA